MIINVNTTTRFYVHATDNTQPIVEGDLLKIVGIRQGGNPLVEKSQDAQGHAFASCDMLPRQKGMAMGFGNTDNTVPIIERNLTLTDNEQLNELMQNLGVSDVSIINTSQVELTHNIETAENTALTFNDFVSEEVNMTQSSLNLAQGTWAVFYHLHDQDPTSSVDIMSNGERQLHAPEICNFNKFMCSAVLLVKSEGQTDIQLISNTTTTYISGECIIYKLN